MTPSHFRPYSRVLALLAALLLAACGDSDTPSPSNNGGANNGDTHNGEPQKLVLEPGCFEARNTATPILGIGALFDDSTWNDPHVVKNEDGTYVMYASSKVGFDGPSIDIYRLVSPDGYEWSLDPQAPVLTPPDGFHSVETPSVVEFGGQFHMFVTTYPAEFDPFAFTIGHATSADGLAFEVVDTSLVAPSGVDRDFDGLIVGEPGAVVVGDVLHLYFTAIGIGPDGSSNQVVALSTSTDGVTFSEPKEVLSLDRERYPRADGWVGLSTPSAMVAGGQVHLFTDVASEAADPMYGSDWRQVALFHAVSDDGHGSWTPDESFIHDLSDFPWAAREIRSITPLLDEGVVRVWYAGDQLFTIDEEGEQVWHTDRWGIGTSECTP